MKERGQKRSPIVVCNTGLQQGPCSGTQGAMVVLEREAPNTGRSYEGKRYKDSGRAERPLCMHQKVMTGGSGRELSEQEEVALFKGLEAGQM